jgi:hypothetical protein
MVGVVGFVAIGMFFLGKWWEATEYLAPPHDDNVIRAFRDAALKETARHGGGEDVYAQAKIITQRVAGYSCLTMLPKSSESEFVVDVCFSDADGKVVKWVGH